MSAVGAPVATDESKRVCYLVNFQSKKVVGQQHQRHQNDSRQMMEPSAKRHKMATGGGQQATPVDRVISSTTTTNTNRNQVLQVNPARQNQIFVHQEDQVNRMRERLFRLLSKVPIQVETIKTTRCHALIHEQTPTSSRKTNASSSDHLRDPLIIKYYQERSLNNIIELHFSCSLIKDYSSKQSMNSEASDAARVACRIASSGPTISNNNQAGWQTTRRDKYQTSKQAHLAEFIGQQQAPPASNHTSLASSVGNGGQQRQKRLSVRQLHQQQQQLPEQHPQQQQSFSISSVRDMRVAPSADMVPQLATHYCHSSSPFFNLTPSSEQQNNGSHGHSMLATACAPFNQSYESNNDSGHPQYSSQSEPLSNLYYQSADDEAALLATSQHGPVYCQPGYTTNEFQAACASNYTTAAISLGGISSSYAETPYDSQPAMLVEASCKAARNQQSIEYPQNGAQLACIVWPQVGYQSQLSSVTASHNQSSDSPNVIEVSTSSASYNNPHPNEPTTDSNFVSYLNPPSFLATQSNQDANQMIDLQETQDQQQQQYGNYFAQQTHHDSHLNQRQATSLICSSRPGLAQVNSESGSLSSASSNNSSTSVSLNSSSPALSSSIYGPKQIRPLFGVSQRGEVQDHAGHHRLQPICMPTNCSSLDVRPIADAHATIHTR